MAKKKTQDDNYLDRIPVINKKYEILEDGIVEVCVENDGFYNSIAQKVFKKPRYSFIKLDEYGSFVWKQIDEQKTIFEIGKLLGEFNEEAKDKLYERLSAFFAILEQHKYITFKG